MHGQVTELKLDWGAPPLDVKKYLPGIKFNKTRDASGVRSNDVSRPLNVEENYQ